MSLDLNPDINSDLGEEGQALTGTSVEFNCTALGVPADLLPSTQLSWTREGDDSELAEATGVRFLLLELSNLRTSDSGNYTCTMTVESDALTETSTTTTVFELQVQTSKYSSTCIHQLILAPQA